MGTQHDTNEQAKSDRPGKHTGIGSTARPDDDALPENSKENLDEALDHGVAETFPGSDPVSVKITK